MARAIDSEAAYQFLTDQLVKESGAFSKGVNKGLNIARSAMRNPDAIPTLTPPNEPLTCAGCYYLDGQCAPCAHCRRAAGYADYYRRPPEGEGVRMKKEEILSILERKTTIPGDGYTWEQINEAFDTAISILSSLNEPQTNEPLTLEQLREMDGEPVYIPEIECWALVKREQTTLLFTFSDGKQSPASEWYEQVGPVYRRPPEGEE